MKSCPHARLLTPSHSNRLRHSDVSLPRAAPTEDAALIAAWKAKGAEVTETQGEITGVSFKTKMIALTPEDLDQIHRLTHLKTFGCAAGFDDAAFAALAGFSELESFSSNGMDASDEGIRILGSLKKLRSVAFFHPGKKFSGAGLAALAELPNLERLTVAGSLEFADEGMAAVAKLPHLKEFRTWHTGVTIEGVKKLRTALQEIKSLTIGQRLANKPPDDGFRRYPGRARGDEDSSSH